MTILKGTRSWRTTLIATCLVTGSVTAAATQQASPVRAAGNYSCAVNDGCVASGQASWNAALGYNQYSGEMYGHNANRSNLGSFIYSSHNSQANNVRSLRNRNSYYISFCAYNLPGYVGALGGANNWSWDGYGNIAQGSESVRFRVQSTC